MQLYVHMCIYLASAVVHGWSPVNFKLIIFSSTLIISVTIFFSHLVTIVSIGYNNYTLTLLT